MKTPRTHPADLPKNAKVRLPDYLRASWAPKGTHQFASLLDAREADRERRTGKRSILF